jgi:hypothetical protein
MEQFKKTAHRKHNGIKEFEPMRAYKYLGAEMNNNVGHRNEKT